MPKADPLPSNTGTPAKQIGPVLDDAEDEQAVKAAAAVFEKYASSLNLLRQVDSATIIGFISSKSASAVTDEELAQLEEPEAAAVADFADETMGGAEQDAIESADAVANYLSEQGIEEEGAVGEEMPMEGEEPLNPEDNPDVAELLLALEEAGISPEELFTEDPMAKAASAVWEELPLRQKAAAIVGLMVRNAAPKVTQAIRKGV